MKRTIRRITFCALIFLAGVAVGARAVHWLVFSPRGEAIAAQVVQCGVRWLNANSVPTWTVAISQDLESAPAPTPPPTRVAAKKGR